jgi:hypothetical protein
MLRYLLLICLLLACEPVVSGKKQVQPRLYSVSVDGLAYGAFDIYGLETFSHHGLPVSDQYSVIKLSRHFIHERSLYRWAWKYKERKTLPKTIYLRGGGQLLGCQPLSWMIEISTGGGYFEDVDVTCWGYEVIYDPN